MRHTYPRHIILDLNLSNYSFTYDYWTLNYSKSFSDRRYFYKSLSVIRNSTLPSTFINSKLTKSTFNYVEPLLFHNTSPKVKSYGTLESLGASKELKLSTKKYTNFLTHFRSSKGGMNAPSTQLNIPTISKSLSSLSKSKSHNLDFTLFDVNFLKKERLYTKLKYSRSPAYDIVSGGSAALLAGFIGFLVSEKFGIELVDSGDFYIVFMYAVFGSFAFRPLLRIMSSNNTIWSVISLNFLLEYFYLVFFIAVRAVKSFPAFVKFTNLNLKREYVMIYFCIIFIALLF